MNKIQIGLNEMEESVIALSYMMSNKEYRKQYCDFLEKNKIEFAIPEVETLSNLLIRNQNQENILENYTVLKQLTKIGYLSTVMDNAYQNINIAVTKAFLSRIKGEQEKISPIIYTDEFKSPKKAFAAFCSGKVKIFLSTEGEYTFMVKSAIGKWIPKSQNYMYLIYDTFIENCESELEVKKHQIEVLKDVESQDKILKLKIELEDKLEMLDNWDSFSNCNEAIEKLKRSHQFILEYDKKNLEKSEQEKSKYKSNFEK